MGFSNVMQGSWATPTSPFAPRGRGGIEPLPVSLSEIWCKRGHELPSPCCDSAVLQDSEPWGTGVFLLHPQAQGDGVNTDKLRCP